VGVKAIVQAPSSAWGIGGSCDTFGQWAAGNCSALPTANAGQYATSHCKPLLFRFP